MWMSLARLKLKFCLEFEKWISWFPEIQHPAWDCLMNIDYSNMVFNSDDRLQFALAYNQYIVNCDHLADSLQNHTEVIVLFLQPAWKLLLLSRWLRPSFTWHLTLTFIYQFPSPHMRLPSWMIRYYWTDGGHSLSTDAKISLFVNTSGWLHILGMWWQWVNSLPFPPAFQIYHLPSTSDRVLNITSDYILRESYTTRNVLWSPASVCLSVCMCVCLSTGARPHYCTDPDVSDVTWGVVEAVP